MRQFVLLSGLLSLAHTIPLPRADTNVPQYVLDYAPIVYLDVNEKFFPSDISAQLVHTHPTRDDFSDIDSAPSPLTLDNLDSLNALAGTDAYLTSNEGIAAQPQWFQGVKPSADGSTPGAFSSVVITVSKPGNILDAFYFYFYAYNQGTRLFGLGDPLGNHVGDWEHTMVRFNTTTGYPQAIWYSQHSLGQAFRFNVVAKDSTGKRPVVYSASGTHANYATPGVHETIIPGQAFPGVVLADHASKGPLWDHLKNTYYYSFDVGTSTFTPSTNPLDNTLAPAPNWLNYVGHWGDPEVADNKVEYSGGPTGPIAPDKRLGRAKVCNVDDNAFCFIKPDLIGAK